MAEKVYLNGKLIDGDEAKVTVFDAGLQHGVGLFETMRSHRGSIFRLGAHVSRLKTSAAQFGMVIDGDDESFAHAIGELLTANGLSDARIRITVTAGSVRVGIHVGPVELMAQDAFGQHVNMAARVLDKARDGGIWVSDRVREDVEAVGLSTERNLRWTEHAGESVKGFPGTYTLWSVTCS